MAYKVFANGFPLQASELNTNLMQQSIAVFLDSVSRDAAITSPVEGQFAYLTASDSLVLYNGTAWVAAIVIPDTSTTVTEQAVSRSLTAADQNRYIYSTAAITITVDDVLAIGETVNLIQNTAGQITFVAGAGVTLNSKETKLKTNKQFSGASVTKKAANSYYLVGDLA